MRNCNRKLLVTAVAFLFTLSVFAQTTTISGTVRDNGTQAVLPAVSITLKGTRAGTFTNDRGDFKLTSAQKLPAILVVSSVGFETQEVTVTDAAQHVNILLKPASTLGTEVVVSASRLPQRILESPVSIERVSAANIRNAPVGSYYDIVSTLKGVDIVTSSLTFKTPSTRGFNASGNLRFNQIVDGMDNQAPGLNFSVGSIIGVTELDVDNMELLPGASSALYGPGGMNGTLLINSKNPFKYQGLSVQIKEGVMHVDQRERNVSPYYDWTVRWAQKISDRFAFKINAEYIRAKDWIGDDYRNYSGRNLPNGKPTYGTRQSDPNYDGINVYGDETTVDLRQFLSGIAGQAPFLGPYVNGLLGSPINVSRTGYEEKDVIDPNTINLKVNAALHYKVSEGTEAVLAGYWGTGNSVYTGSDRYSLKDLKIGQYKLEFNNRNWFIRAYTTQENAGQSFNATVTTRLFNEAWKPSYDPNNVAGSWYPQYAQAYLGALASGSSDIDAHNLARSIADQGRPQAGSAQFRQIFDQVRSVPISKGGGLFVDKTDLYNIEGQYNLSQFTSSFADILVGGNFKRYELNSEGTLFADSTHNIGINEVGAYIQASRRIAERVTLTLAGRYDKNQNFTGRFTPRATAVIKLAENNNLRLSFQTAYRFPSTQQQWINLNVGNNTKLIGGLPDFATFYNFGNNPIYSLASVQAGGPKQATFAKFKPESVTSYEIGYKSLVAQGKLLIDLYGYYGQYQDFIVRTTVIQARDGNPANLGNQANWNVYSIPTNAPGKVETYGYGISLDYRLPLNFSIGGNFSSDVLNNVPEGLIASFNAPRYRTNLSFANTGIGKSKLLGFSIVYHWNDAYEYQGDFGNGNIHSVNTLDAQVSYRIPKIKALIKLGGTNLLNQYYTNGIGNSVIGGLYYVSFGYNIF